MVQLDFTKVDSAIINNGVIISTSETNGFIITQSTLTRYSVAVILNNLRYVYDENLDKCLRDSVVGLYNQLII